MELLLSQNRVAVSVITVYELFRGVKNKRHIQQREQFVGLCQEYPLDTQSVRIAAEIYGNLRDAGRLISNEDILIAATAVNNSIPLFTVNAKHFERIVGIRLHRL